MKQLQNVTFNVDNREQLQREVQLILLLKPLNQAQELIIRVNPKLPLH